MLANQSLLQDALVLRPGSRLGVRDLAHIPDNTRGGPCNKMLLFTFGVDVQHAPAFRSVVDEMTTRIGQRLEQPHRYDKETALTYASIALGRLRAAVHPLVGRGDPNYE